MTTAAALLALNSGRSFTERSSGSSCSAGAGGASQKRCSDARYQLIAMQYPVIFDR